MELILLGDVCLVNTKGLCIDKDILGAKPSLCLANLETPFRPEGSIARPKAGPVLSGSKETLSLVRSNFDKLCFSLANNHMMDYGTHGLEETLSHCHQADILTLGAGKDIIEARQHVIYQEGSVRVGILSCCETQFGTATVRRAGVATIDPTIYQAIRQLKSNVDVVVVSIHGASEMCPWPSPKWRELLRSFVDAGARIVHGHHAHVPQGYESYLDGVIFYGLGNFLVDPGQWQDRPNTCWSMVAKCVIDSGKLTYSVKTVVIEKARNGLSVRLSRLLGSEAHQIYTQRCNQPLNDPALLEGLWQEAAVRMFRLYYKDYLGFSLKSTRIQKIKSLFKSAKDGQEASVRDKQLLWYHLFACESHSDAIATALGVLGGEIEDMRSSETGKLADQMMSWSVGSN